MINENCVRQIYMKKSCTNHVATLPTEQLGYIEVSITNEKPKHYQVYDINTLIRNNTHTNLPDITGRIPQTNYSLQDIRESVPFNHFSLHQVFVTNFDTPLVTSPLYNVQPGSNTSKPRIFPSLPDTTDNLKIINKFNFQFPNLTDTECITLCNLLPKYKTCYATHKMMLVRLQPHFVLDLNLTLNLLHNGPIKSQSIIVTN